MTIFELMTKLSAFDADSIDMAAKATVQANIPGAKEIYMAWGNDRRRWCWWWCGRPSPCGPTLLLRNPIRRQRRNPQHHLGQHRREVCQQPRRHVRSLPRMARHWRTPQRPRPQTPDDGDPLYLQRQGRNHPRTQRGPCRRRRAGYLPRRYRCFGIDFCASFVTIGICWW